ncbi:MAG: hypothetical protein U1F43_34385 [Myxococcota bacterium]
MGTAGLAFFAARVGRRAAFHVGLFVGFLASAWLSRLHSGGIANVLIPGFAALAVMAPIGMAALEPQPVAGLRGPGAAATRIGLALFVAFQFFALGYSTGDSLPAPDAREKGAKFTEYLSHIDGDVLLPDHDFIQRRAGKRDYALGMASRDLLRMESSDDPGKLMLEASIREAFASRRFAAVILSEEDHLRSLLLPTYCFKERIDLAPSPITGWVIRPQWVWVPRLAGTPTDRVECMR